MNRPIIITAGIAILLVVLGVWVYLVFFGAPKSSGEVFTNLGFNLPSQGTTIQPPPNTGAPIEDLIDTKTGSLRQLTTRPVAGFMATTTPEGEKIRYVERGTGHVYEIALKTGVENIISRTTIPQAAVAVFNTNATLVAVTSYQDYAKTTFVGSLKNGSLEGTQLEPGADNVSLDGTTAYYTIVRNNATVGYRHNLSSGVRNEVFTFAFTNLDVWWESQPADAYLVPKPAASLPGYVYAITSNRVAPLAVQGIGLSTLIENGRIVASSILGDTVVSRLYKADGSQTSVPLTVLKEKCTFDAQNTNYLWCAAPAGDISGTTLFDWYMGVATLSDYLWLVNLESQTAALTAAPEKLVGRSLDIIDLAQSSTGTAVLFKNKFDQTLWLYDLTAE